MTGRAMPAPVGPSRRALLRGSLAGLGLGGVAATTGCAGTLPLVDTTVSGFGENAEGTVRVWCRANTQKAIQSAAATLDNPRLNVRITPIPDAQYVTKLATAIRGDSVPDLVDLDLINCPLFTVRDSFADLTRQVAAVAPEKTFSAGHLGEIAQDGKRYGAPFLGDYSTLWLNQRLLAQADVDPAQATASLESISGALNAIKRAVPDAAPWSFPGNAQGALGFTVLPMVWAAGTDLFSGSLEEQHGDIADNAALEAVLEFHHRLWTDGLVSRKAFSDDASQWGADFRAGEVAMMPSNYGTIMLTAEPEQAKDFTNVLLPGPDGGVSMFSGGDNLCIPNGAPNPSGAWELCRHLLEVEVQEKLPEAGFLPVRQDAATDAFRSSFPQALPPVENIESGHVPLTLAYNLIFNQQAGPWLAMFRSAVFDGDVKGAMRTAQSEVDRILDQARL